MLELERAKERGEEVLAAAMRRRDELASALRDQRAELRGLRAEHERREARLAEREARVTEESERLAVRLRQLDDTQTEIGELREALARQKPTWPRFTPSRGTSMGWAHSAARRTVPSPPNTTANSAVWSSKALRSASGT